MPLDGLVLVGVNPIYGSTGEEQIRAVKNCVFFNKKGQLCLPIFQMELVRNMNLIRLE